MATKYPKIICASVRLAGENDQHLEAFDNTKLQALNTCPTWGILRYQMHRTYHKGARAMALEAGSACHEVFAAVRTYQLMFHDGLYEHGLYHGPKIFDALGPGRFEDMLSEVSSNEDDRTNSINFALRALHTSGFYDDPSDRRRTMTNLEEACIAYIDRWNFKKELVWVRDINNPEADVGIEIPFDLVVTLELDDGSSLSARYTGKCDGLHTRGTRLNSDPRSELNLHENKTASRIDDAWRNSFEMASQVTGYCLAISCFAGLPLSQATVHGLQIPLPRTHEFNGIVSESVKRYDFHFRRWFDWFYHCVMMYKEFENNPISAPKYTHSCNRYFRSCSFIPFCASDDDEQRLAIEEMQIDEWSPLAEKSGD